jgi:STE24 endopeptidase
MADVVDLDSGQLTTESVVDRPEAPPEAHGRRRSHWRRVPADPRDWFDRAEIDRGRAYNKPLERLSLARLALGGAVTIAFIVGEAAPRLLDALGVEGWALQLVVVIVAFEAVTLIVAPWFEAYRALVYDRRWGLSTQTGRLWVLDQVKDLALALVLSIALAVPLYALIRSTELWWLFGWLLFSGFTLAFGFLWPVVIAPLFNRFTPLDDAELAARLAAVADRAGLEISGVFVNDASKRTNATNAYVAGLGRTRRVVLFDTILRWPPEPIEQVVAHELGHWKHAHLRRKIPVLVVAQLVMFLSTWALLQWEWLLDVAGIESVGDPASFPLLISLFPLSLLLTGLGTAWLSRADERQADIHALEVLDRPDELADVYRRLAADHNANVDPSRWKRLKASHPPLAERMQMAKEWGESGAVPAPDVVG